MKLEQNIQEMSACMLAMRRMQDKSEMTFLASLGGLSLPQLNVLNAIGDQTSGIMSDIAKQVTLSLSSVTLIVDKLEKLKLAHRERSTRDRRVVRVGLTPEGKKIYQIQIEHLHQVSRKLLSALNDAEQTMFITILNKLTQATVISEKENTE